MYTEDNGKHVRTIPVHYAALVNDLFCQRSRPICECFVCIQLSWSINPHRGYRLYSVDRDALLIII